MAVLATFANCSGSGRAYRCRPGTSCSTSSALNRAPPRVAIVPPVARNLMRGGSLSAHESMPVSPPRVTAVSISARTGGLAKRRNMPLLLYGTSLMLVGAGEPIAQVGRRLVRRFAVEVHHRGGD